MIISLKKIFLAGLGFELRASHFAKQAFYHLSHTSGPKHS
jgi:hypothetical protein